jgi:DNA ligase D-like protein (predicted 3'-phosphoesterase)
VPVGKTKSTHVRAKKLLKEYAGKRDFARTTEPAGSATRGEGREFVVQKHAARRLHYDLRLEIDGVLKSWAVTKGPSLTVGEKRLAVRTEDHPIEYLNFEGNIPKGEYGAGPMIVWDRGVFQNISETRRGEPMELADAIEKGDVKILMLGEKIKGAYALVRTGPAGDREKWLLIKKRDGGADARRRPTSSQPESVLSGRTIEEVMKEEG